MPAKKQISKNEILEAAYRIVQRDGREALSVRAVAKECRCSTQPIYLSFSGIESLEEQLLKKIEGEFEKVIEAEIAMQKYPEYKAVGMGYIRFSKEEKNLFKYLLMRDRTGGGKHDFENRSFDKSTYIIMKNYGLYSDGAHKLHAEMWIFVHGIATMFATGYLDWEWETVSQMVSDVYKGLIAQIKGEENGN